MEIKELKAEWNAKNESKRNTRLQSKGLVNTHYESLKCKDVECLKEKGGPFAKANQVEHYMKLIFKETVRNQRFC